MDRWWRKKKSEEAVKKQTLVHENGKVLLEKLIEYCNGKSNPIKTFSASQIFRATDNFSHNNALVRSRPSSYQCYKGMMEDRLVLVKNWVAEYSSRNGKICCDIAISSMVSGHKNFLKLLGCCLEFPYPVLVYEYAESIICRPQNGSKYLHSHKMEYENEDCKGGRRRFSIPSHYILKEYIDNSVLIPEGEKFVEGVIERTFGYLDHNYMNTGRVTENTDLYGFGAFMLTLLTAMNPSLVDKLYKDCPIKLVEDDRFVEIIDPEVLESCKEQELLQVKAILILSLRGIGCVGEVPKMIEVGKELKRMLVQAKTKLH